MARRSPVVEVSPLVLRWARESSGLNVSQVATRVHISPARVESWEEGTESPTFTELEQLARRVYKRPIAALLLLEPPEQAAAPKDFRVLPPEVKEPFSTKVFLAVRRARRIARILSELAEGDWPTWQRPMRLTLATDPEDAARELRSRSGVDVGMQRNWTNVKEAFRAWRTYFERQGIVVLQLPMPVREARGFSLVEKGIPVIVVNVSDVPSARSFSLLHEYAHLLLDDSGICQMEEGQGQANEARVEAFCNRFAASFLVPADSLLNHQLVRSSGRQNEWPDETLRALAGEFKVSQEVVLRRLVSLRYATRQFYRGKREDWAALQKKPGGRHINPPRECVDRLGTAFVGAVLRSRQRGKITRSDVADYLGLKMKHMDTLAKILGQEGE